jgi:hypothetical protein
VKGWEAWREKNLVCVMVYVLVGSRAMHWDTSTIANRDLWLVHFALWIYSKVDLEYARLLNSNQWKLIIQTVLLYSMKNIVTHVHYTEKSSIRFTHIIFSNKWSIQETWWRIYDFLLILSEVYFIFNFIFACNRVRKMMNSYGGLELRALNKNLQRIV